MKSDFGLESSEWRDRAYERTFEAVFAALEARRKADPSFTAGDAAGTLRHLYVQEGSDDGSRGMLQDAVLAATIAAHEQFISIWKAEDASTVGHDRSTP